MKPLIPAFILCLLIIPQLIPAGAIAQESFRVGDVEAAAGARASGYLEIAPRGGRNGDGGTQIPVTVIQGTEEGPVLALIAGTHGYEYAPILALHRVRKALDPQALAGTVIMVHVANMPSFLGRTIYYSPADGENLNRVYPGKANGTLSERIAYAITQEVINKSDYVIDLHSGDGNEALRPYLYMPVTGDPDLDRRTRDMAVAFGLDHIVIDDNREIDPENTRFTDQTALARGVPAMTTETGQLGRTDDHWVSMATRGVWGVLAHLRMIDAPADENPQADETGIVWLEDYQVITSPATGLFHAAVKDGYAVAEGTLLGTLVDFFGDPITEIRSPFAGVVNYVVATPPVSEGEPVAMVSRVASVTRQH
ncbi:MAG: M14 family metallopeptidase [Parvularculaceae bacterium]